MITANQAPEDVALDRDTVRSERMLPHGARAVVDGRRGDESPYHCSTLDTRADGDTVDRSGGQPITIAAKRELTK